MHCKALREGWLLRGGMVPAGQAAEKTPCAHCVSCSCHCGEAPKACSESPLPRELCTQYFPEGKSEPQVDEQGAGGLQQVSGPGPPRGGAEWNW